MNHLSKEEVLGILENAEFYIFDELEWRTRFFGNHQIEHTIEHGLVDQRGRRTEFYMSIQIKINFAMKTKTSLFSLMKDNIGTSRIYQLDIRRLKTIKKTLADAHLMPHEHIGERQNGDLSWLEWSFEECLALFLQRCKITLCHEINDPEPSYRRIK